MTGTEGDQIEIVVNGETRSVLAGATIGDLLRELAVSKRGVAVEINGQIQPLSDHDSTRLKVSDQVEIVSLVGGG